MWSLVVSRALLVTDLGGRTGVLSAPLFLNLHFVIIPVCTLATIASLSGILYRSYQQLSRNLATVLAVVADGEGNWNSLISQEITLAEVLNSVTPPLQKFFTTVDDLQGWFRATFIGWFIATVYLYSVGAIRATILQHPKLICAQIIAVVAFLHIQNLRETLLTPFLEETQQHARHRQLKSSLAQLGLAVFCIVGVGGESTNYAVALSTSSDKQRAVCYIGLSGWLGFASSGLSAPASILRSQTLMGL